MHTIRKYLSWVFALTSIICVQVLVTHGGDTIQQLTAVHRVAPDRYFRFYFLFLLVPSMMIAFAVVFGMAWWTTFKGKRSSRWWGIAASLIVIQASLLPLTFPPHWMSSGLSLVLALGILGLVAFAKPIQPMETQDNIGLVQPYPDDGTNALLSKLIPLLTLGVAYAAYEWWSFGLVSVGISRIDNAWYQTFANFLVLFLIAVIHEAGHAAAGFALGMKLRAFVVGPFQWRVFDGEWKFRFDLKQILVVGGSAGVVPTSVQYRRSDQLWVASGGVLANVITGGCALGIAFTLDANSSIQYGGLLALFGLWSVVIAPVNLVPFKVGGSYSDGAQIYQVMSRGPWAELQRAFSIAGSTLVTPLRPRDYDIGAIQRAAQVIDRGWHGLLLRLMAYSYFFDDDKMREAAAAIGEAALIYNDCSSEVSAELLTPFVFCNAYICRSAGVARQWWSHLEAKKPVRLNVDYWLAASALHWIEGDLKNASEAWGKANALAHNLPQAGSYDFDRDCCVLLRRTINEAAVVT